MVTPDVLAFLALHNLTSIAAWADRAGVSRQAVYHARLGRGLAKVHLVKLAAVVGESPERVAELLGVRATAPRPPSIYSVLAELAAPRSRPVEER